MWGLLISLFERFGPLLAGPVSQLVTGINLDAVFANIKKYWKVYGVLLLACLQIVTAYGWNSDHRALGAERASHRADIKSYEKAQKDAQDEIVVKTKQLQQESKVKADAADQNYSTLLAKYRASVMRYKALAGSRSGPGSGEQLQAPKSGDGPSADTELPPSLTISGTDAEICAVNTARLQAVHDWAVQK